MSTTWRPLSGTGQVMPRIVARKVATERILAEVDRLAPLPTVVMDVIRAVEDPKASVADLERIISYDLIITARVIKLANSSFYARGEPARTIGDAVKRLGFKTIKNLVVAAGAGKVLMRPMRHYTYKAFGLWQHSLGLALTTRSLARHLGLPSAMQDELFLAGLLHDVGKLVLDPILAEFVGRTRWLTTAMESDAVGLDHTEVGQRIAVAWKLPTYVVAVIKQHHSLDTDVDFAQHSAAIHVGDYLINQARVGIAQEAEVACEVHPTALRTLCLDPQSMQELQTAVVNELPHIMGLCEELVQC